MISAVQVEEEKAQVNKLFRRHGLPMLIEWVIGIVVLVVMGWMLYMALYSDAARSKGLSEVTTVRSLQKPPWAKCWMTFCQRQVG